MVGDTSQLHRFQPRHAGLAAQSPGLQDQRVVDAVKKNEGRRRLPLTHLDYLRMRMDQPR
jgi:hypothetical protein